MPALQDLWRTRRRSGRIPRVGVSQNSVMPIYEGLCTVLQSKGAKTRRIGLGIYAGRSMIQN